MEKFLLNLEGKLQAKVGAANSLAIVAALPWLLTAVSLWVGVTQLAAFLWVGGTYSLVLAVIGLVLAGGLNVANPNAGTFGSKLSSSVRQYSQLGLIAAAVMAVIPALVVGGSEWLTIALLISVVAALVTLVMAILRPGVLMSHKLDDSQRPSPMKRGDSNSLVAVIMPCWNEERFIKDAIDSLKAQTHKNWELTIVDDGSSDSSTRIAVSAAQKDKRIRVLRLRRNSGLPSARNAGFAFTNAPFVIFLDSDDALLSESIEARLALAESHPDAWGVSFRARQVPEDTDWRSIREISPNARVAHIDLPSTIGDSPFGVHEVMVRSERVRQLAGFNEDMVGGAEDAHFWLRSLRAGATYVRKELVDSIYRQKTGSMIGDNIVRQAKVTVQVMVDSWNASVRNDLDVEHASDSTGDILLRQRVQLRLFRFLGMTYFGTDPAVRPEIEELIKAHGPIVIRPDQMLTALRTGVMRNLARTPDVNVVVEADKYTDEFDAVIAKWYGGASAPLANRIDHAMVAVLIENAAQFANLHAAFAEASDDKLPVLVLADSLDAPQGAWDAVERSGRPYVTRSIPAFALEGVEYAELIIPAPVSWIGEQLADLYAATNTVIKKWDLPWSQGVNVDDEDYLDIRTMSFGLEAETVTSAQLASSNYTKGSIARVQLPALVWPTVNSVDSNGSGGDYTGLISPDLEKLRALKDKHKGERCIIIGNGPSLNQTDFSLLTDQNTFGVNGIFYADDRLPQPLTYYVVEDTKVFEENTEAILEYGRGCGEIILPTLYKKSVENPEEVTFFRMNGGFYRRDDPNFCRPRFSTNAEEVLYCGQSVTFINLQLAYWMGFSEVALIGMDFSYSLPPGTVVRGHLYESQEDDPNHFDPRYFGKGKTWKNPYLNRVGANYELAKAMFEADGRKVYNCTVGGKLEVFDRLDLEVFVKGIR